MEKSLTGSAFLEGKWVKFAICLALILFAFSNNLLLSFQSYIVGFLFATSIIGCVHFIDSVILKNVDTRYEIIEKQNIAYALVYTTFALCVISGFAIAISIFFTWK